MRFTLYSITPIIILRHNLIKGVKTINITEKTGDLVSIQAVEDDNDLMIINKSGITIRTKVAQNPVAGRATQGVRIINLRDGDSIASVMAVPKSEEEEPQEGVVVDAENTTEAAAVEQIDAVIEQAETIQE